MFVVFSDIKQNQTNSTFVIFSEKVKLSKTNMFMVFSDMKTKQIEYALRFCLISKKTYSTFTCFS